jgi:NADPH:quinone reductase-like Zn-dependent oxidoreductase
VRFHVPGVTDFAVGDVVCADLGLCETCLDPAPAQGNAGAFAQYAVVPAGLATKTNGIDRSHAAGLPLAGLTAYQALFTKSGRTFTGADLGSLKSGQKVLILGGATLVGSFAIQLAKNVGAFVACTASTKPNASGVSKIEQCKTFGADVAIDYAENEWSDVLKGEEYDLIFDTVGKEDDWVNAAKVLKKGCDFISVANFAADVSANETNVFKNFLLKSDAGDLAELVQMVKDGKLLVTVDSVVPFSEAPAALTKSLTGANCGKIVVDVASA